MNQQWLIDHVLETGPRLPVEPSGDASYLTMVEAEAIVDHTLDELGASGDPIEYSYMRGHRKRLAHTLTMIPKAGGPGQSLLDVGCYGYMGLWAKTCLGYERVVGIEWLPENDQDVIERELRVGDECVCFSSYNFDITRPEWPIEAQFDTVLFLEVLEHVNEDPMGVMQRINALMHDAATLVMSVPNAISYKVLREFLVGMPPWTYWFYEPDLQHEPRHCFEYTPIVFQSLLIASGMNPNAFRTIYAYSSPEKEHDTLQIAESLGFHSDELGETMIAHATKTRTGVPLRYPDVLYSPDGYYKNIYPRLQQVLQERIKSYRLGIEQRHTTTGSSEIEHKPGHLESQSETVDDQIQFSSVQRHQGEQSEHQLRSAQSDLQELIQDRDAQRSWAEQLASQGIVLESRVIELLQICDDQLHQKERIECELQSANVELQQVTSDRDEQREWSEQLASKVSTLQGQVNELLFQSDCRMQREKELIEQAEQATISQQKSLSETQDMRTLADQLSVKNAELRSQVNELLFACDCYLQQLNDPSHCVRVIRQKRFRWALDRTKSVARKTPIVRTAMRPVYRSAKRFIKRRM